MIDSPSDARIAPWLEVNDGERAVEFYGRALGATEAYRLTGDDNRIAVAQLNVGDAASFWIQAGPSAITRPTSARPIRLILSVDDPDRLHAQAVAAGATEVATVHDSHGWRTGRVTDPFGHDWEFSKQLTP